MSKYKKPDGIPKDETVWETFYKQDGGVGYIITSKNNSRDWYYLYAYDNGALKKRGKARTPPEARDKYYFNVRW